VTLAQAVGDLGAGLALLTAGGVAWARVRDSRTGPLLVIAGVTWLAGDVVGALIYAHRGPLVHVLLTFPSGRARAKPIIVLIVAAYVDGLLPAAAREPWTTVALMTAVLGAAVSRLSTRGPERHARRVAGACTAGVSVPLLAASVARLAGADIDVVATWLYEAAIVLTATALAAELITGRSARAATTDLVVHLGHREEPRALRDALARAVGDPALEIAYRVDEGWVDEAGQPVHLPTPEHSGDRRVMLVKDAGSPVAALVHDAAALRDRSLAQSVSAAVRLVLANVRLQAEDTARMREVTASRRRLVEAGDEQRRRLGEQLHDGAERLLADVSAELAAVAAGRDRSKAADIDGLIHELGAASTDLTRFAQGVHPAVLTEHGLGEALRDLADHAGIPVVVRTVPGRFAPAQEAAVFFLCSETLANVAKYAAATSASVDVEHAGPHLVVRVADDGRGGADPTRGSGLRGLKDRVEALGGRFTIRSPVGAGTRVEAELPIRTERS
jgi:signal transduction histidine kinase